MNSDSLNRLLTEKSFVVQKKKENFQHEKVFEWYLIIIQKRNIDGNE